MAYRFVLGELEIRDISVLKHLIFIRNIESINFNIIPNI